MVFDSHRGMRRTASFNNLKTNSNEVLSPLFLNNPNRQNVEVSFFTPNQKSIPLDAFSSLNMFREALGTYHTKFLVFDNNVILTGANLSEEYFLNRKDRYMIINDCPELADYLQEFLESVAESGDRFDSSERAAWSQSKYERDYSNLSQYFGIFGRLK